MTARTNVEVVAGSMYWLTSRTLRSTSRSTWAVSWARRGASSPRLGQLLEGGAGDPFGVDREKLAPGQCQGQLDDLAAHPDVALEHLGRQGAQVSARMFSPAAPRVELPAITASRRRSWRGLVLDRLASGEG